MDHWLLHLITGEKRVLIGLSLLLCVAFSSTAFADETDEFANAKNAFEAGEYEAAIIRFNALLESGLQNPALELEVLKLLGICYLFTGEKEAAEKYFTKLLTQSPNYTLDPLLYPIEVVDFFTEIKQKNEKRLEELARVQALEEKRRRAEEERRRKAEIEKLKRNVYLERNRKQYSKIVAFMPFGAGQFQNGQMLKGTLFLAFELVLTGTAITSYFLHDTLRTPALEKFKDQAEDQDKKREYETKEKVYRVINHASLGVLGAVVIAGVADALLNYKSESIEWRNVKEKDVPEHLRPGKKHKKTKASKKVSLSLGAGKFSVALGISGRF